MKTTYRVVAVGKPDDPQVAIARPEMTFPNVSAAFAWIVAMRKIPGSDSIIWHLTRIVDPSDPDLLSANASMNLKFLQRGESNVVRICDLADSIQDAIGVRLRVRFSMETATITIPNEHEASLLLRQLRKMIDGEPSADPVACDGFDFTDPANPAPCSLPKGHNGNHVPA